jgi:alpha-beta hydrolase superfamily lysophospholipase
LSYTTWRPVGDCRRTIAVLHGIGFNGEPYASVIEDLPLQGTRLTALDLRGHGTSEGNRGSLPHHDRIISDISEWLGLLKQESPGLHLYVLGESMGVIYATLFAMAHGSAISGLILVAPPIVPSMKQLLHFDTARTILSLAIPFMRHHISLTGWRLAVGSADEDFVKYRRTSTLALSSVSIGYMARLGRAIASIGLVRRVQIECPILLAYGSDDKVVSPLGCRLLFSRIANPDKTLLEVRGARHTVLWDPHRAKLFSGLARWIQDHE